MRFSDDEQDFPFDFECHRMQKRDDGKEELAKMKNNPAKSGGSAQKANASAGKSAGGAKSGSASSAGGAGGSGGQKINHSASGGTGTASDKEVDKGGKYDAKKALLNKFKFKLQKNTSEEEKAEAEINRCNPCNEFDARNGCDLGCVDWGKCAFVKPCCKRMNPPCSCFAYMCMGVTFVGGLLSSILLF